MNVAIVTQLVTRLASSWLGFGPRLVRGQVSPCLQNTRRLSDVVAHLGLQPRRVGQDRFVSDLVVVKIGGQLGAMRTRTYVALTLTGK